ncbi:MAG: dihydroorotase, partial [Clostridia bacterium]|nr:dihydroorotase [Clostridia bacterium]
MSLLIKAGRIIDPSQNLDRVADLLVRAGRIDKIEPDINTRDAETIIDARGLIVAPG